MLVSDLDGVKMISLDDESDKSVYVAVQGRPFVANIVALAFDASTSTAYYSDNIRYCNENIGY